jgi:hypothetical protein
VHLRISTFTSLLLVVLGGFSLPTRADLIGAVVAVPAANTVYNLTTLGTVDWTFYDPSANPANGLPTNDKLGGSAIGTVTALGGGSLRGQRNQHDGTRLHLY